MTADAEILVLRKRRNRFIWFAAASLALSIGLSLPRRLARYATQKEVNQELLRLQAEIVAAQGKIRTVQGEILAVQGQLKGGAAK